MMDISGRRPRWLWHVVHMANMPTICYVRIFAPLSERKKAHGDQQVTSQCGIRNCTANLGKVGPHILVIGDEKNFQPMT